MDKNKNSKSKNKYLFIIIVFSAHISFRVMWFGWTRGEGAGTLCRLPFETVAVVPVKIFLQSKISIFDLFALFARWSRPTDLFTIENLRPNVVKEIKFRGKVGKTRVKLLNCGLFPNVYIVVARRDSRMPWRRDGKILWKLKRERERDVSDDETYSLPPSSSSTSSTLFLSVYFFLLFSLSFFPIPLKLSFSFNVQQNAELQSHEHPTYRRKTHSSAA